MDHCFEKKVSGFIGYRFCVFGRFKMCKKKIHEILEESEKLKENLEQINKSIDEILNMIGSRLNDQEQRQNFIDLFDAQTRLERLKIEAEKARNRQWHITANILICSFCCVACIVTYLITKDNSNLIHYIHEYVFRGI